MAKKKTIKEQIEHSEQYIAFLEKALASNNFKKKVALEPHLFEEEYDKIKKKLEREKTLLKFLKK